ncbi:MAG: GP88 family protein [Myxococcaceae bacterium]
MPYVRNLLTRGNGKLEEGVYAWSIPTIETCPGRSGPCSRVCYVRSGRFKTRTMQSRLSENLAAAQADDFVARITAEIHRRGVHTLRIHVHGDFFDADHSLKWAAIARGCPRTTLYGYTRSWRVPPILTALKQLARLRNVRLWFPCHAETGVPSDIPPGVRVAYLQTERHEKPAVDLVFRVRHLRGQPASLFPLTVVCPTEISVHHLPNITCTSCRLCHR